MIVWMFMFWARVAMGLLWTTTVVLQRRCMGSVMMMMNGLMIEWSDD